MEAAFPSFPDNVGVLKVLRASAPQKIDQIEANPRARENTTAAMIAHLKLQSAKLRRERYGPSAERTERLASGANIILRPHRREAARCAARNSLLIRLRR